jgi:hypothetical protein
MVPGTNCASRQNEAALSGALPPEALHSSTGMKMRATDAHGSRAFVSHSKQGPGIYFRKKRCLLQNEPNLGGRYWREAVGDTAAVVRGLLEKTNPLGGRCRRRDPGQEAGSGLVVLDKTNPFASLLVDLFPISPELIGNIYATTGGETAGATRF